MVWHRSRRADLSLRAGGLCLLVISGLALRRLIALHIASGGADAFAFLLALIAFLSASLGSAATLLGGHLFDEVEVSARWRRAGRDRALQRGE
ncbi:hypothetical protein [Sphingomonas beigongshangi]|uniref:hypothetical protein n=1 Tax=Sphingomonas beigongshangi TaxID=2782540 RepID=UPI00193C6200|nr:hypothetical protein [Sphingomonas beigongshangi]